MNKNVAKVNRTRASMLSGTEAEMLACKYLQKKGLKLLERNFATRRREIDLVMQDRSCLVFVEVRFRQSTNYGSAEESISQRKCQRLQAAALAYLQQRGQSITIEARFDAVAISPDHAPRGNFAINWVQNILI
ncbi:MAG: YraN family protein [Porticoccaceae bacterium]